MGSNRVVAGPREALATTSVALRGARLHRAAGEVDRVKLRYRSQGAARAAWRPSTAAAASSSSCSSPSTAPRPGRPRACCAATWSSGGGRSPRARLHRCHGDDHRRDPRAVPLLLRAARPQAPAVVPADPAGERHLDAADHRRDAAAQAVPERAREAAAQPPHGRPEGVPHARHRGGRLDLQAPHVLRDDGQLLDRRLLQARGGAVRVGPLAARASGSTADDIWVTVFEGDDAARDRPRRGGRAGVAGHRRAARADRAVQPQGELLGVRPDRPLRAVLGALPRPRPGLRQGRRPARRRQRALHGVLEPRVHAVRPGAAQHAHAAAGQEHRHRPRAGAARVAAAGRAERVRDRRVPAAGRAGGGAQRPQLRHATSRPTARCGSSPTTRAARASCSPTASCPPTRAAATRCGGSCGARSCRAAGSASRARSWRRSRRACAT